MRRSSRSAGSTAGTPGSSPGRRRFVDVHPDPDGFLAEPFTRHQLRRVHEAVLGADLHKDDFSRRMKPYLQMVTDDGDPVLADGLRGRPAALFRVARD